MLTFVTTYGLFAAYPTGLKASSNASGSDELFAQPFKVVPEWPVKLNNKGDKNSPFKFEATVDAQGVIQSSLTFDFKEGQEYNLVVVRNGEPK